MQCMQHAALFNNINAAVQFRSGNLLQKLAMADSMLTATTAKMCLNGLEISSGGSVAQ